MNMAPESTVLTTKVGTESPYKLDKSQVNCIGRSVSTVSTDAN